MDNLQVQEHWRQIPKYPGYLVSDSGKVASTKLGPDPYEMKLSTNADGDSVVSLTIEKKKVRVKVAALVASAFLEVPDFPAEVGHLDGNKTNNHAVNLFWGSHKEIVSHLQSCDRNARVRQEVRCVETGVIFRSVQSAADHMGVTWKQMNRAINRNGLVKGFHFALVQPRKKRKFPISLFDRFGF